MIEVEDENGLLKNGSAYTRCSLLAIGACKAVRYNSSLQAWESRKRNNEIVRIGALLTEEDTDI